MDEYLKKENIKVMILGYSYWIYSLILLFTFIWDNRDPLRSIPYVFSGNYRSESVIEFQGFVLFVIFSWIGDGLLWYLKFWRFVSFFEIIISIGLRTFWGVIMIFSSTSGSLIYDGREIYTAKWLGIAGVLVILLIRFGQRYLLIRPGVAHLFKEKKIWSAEILEGNPSP
ncbi:MAG: hypothetical protein OEY93_07215 [Anaerolineae bacterium]|nr:hypothetical protein [Anaerolineae bacterium]